MDVQRRCHVCEEPIRSEVAYARTLHDDDGARRIYAHPSCFFDAVDADERSAYQRERLADEPDERDEAPAEASPADEPSPSPARPRPAIPDADAIVEAVDLAKTYPDGTEAVKAITFTVRRGEIYGILGPNGAGKTTAIGMLGTMVKPTGGQARVAGVDVQEDPGALKPKLGFAMQEVGVDELATGREFLHLQARLYGLSRETARERADELLDLFELTEAADKRIGGYSGGMQRRIDLAAALLHEPEVIFLDEPTEGLDPRGRREMWSLVERLNRELDATILLSTHYMEEADALCDRLAIMDRGEIVVEGTPQALKDAVGEASIVLTYEAADPDGHARAAEALLTSNGLVDEVRRSGAQVRAYVSDTARAIPPLMRALEREGLAPEGLSVTDATLDDVYLAYTGRSIEAAERAEAEPAGVEA